MENTDKKPTKIHYSNKPEFLIRSSIFDAGITLLKDKKGGKEYELLDISITYN